MVLEQAVHLRFVEYLHTVCQSRSGSVSTLPAPASVSPNCWIFFSSRAGSISSVSSSKIGEGFSLLAPATQSREHNKSRQHRPETDRRLSHIPDVFRQAFFLSGLFWQILIVRLFLSRELLWATALPPKGYEEFGLPHHVAETDSFPAISHSTGPSKIDIE